MGATFTVRPGGLADTPAVLRLYDAAIAWMVDNGLTSQWGSTPFSTVPARVAKMRARAEGGGLRVCELDGEPVAAMVLGGAQSYVPAATRPEIYIEALIGSPLRPEARGAGARLLRLAEGEARDAGIGLLRVDCFAGNGGALVRYYESVGFVRTGTFTVDVRTDGGTPRPWPGQVLEREVDLAPRQPPR